MKKILFVDDEKEIQSIIMKIFPKTNYRIICASDGVEAMMKIRNEEFDIIISDYRMPKMDGIKFYDQMRDVIEAKKKKITPILFVSSHADEIRASRSSWIYCEFLNKPFQVYEILQRVSKLVGEVSTDKEAASNAPSTQTEGKIVLAAGDKLFEEGEKTDLLFYVVSGVLSAHKTTASGEAKKIGNIYAGELIGELAIIDDSCHSMTIIADEPCELIVIPSSKIIGVINGQSKWVKLILENMSKRMRQALKQIA